MKKSDKAKISNRIWLIIVFVLLAFMITYEMDVFYVIVILNVIIAIALWMSRDDFRHYKKQTYIVKTWLQCLVIASVFSFLTLLVAIFGIIFGTYQL